jgi:urea transport system permease protein
MKNLQSVLQHYIHTWGGITLVALILLSAPVFLSDFRLTLLGKFLTFAIAAMGMVLIWGYGGMLSLGQGLFFGLGAYAFAMYLKLETAQGRLPDFMVWSGLSKLPWFWVPFQSPIFALVMVLVAPTLIAMILGFFIFRSRIQGVYFSIITQAMTLLVSILLVGQQPYTGGTNGLTNLTTIFGNSLANQGTKTALYFVTVIFLILVYIFCRQLTNSRFGRLLVAMRDDEARVRFLGYDPVIIKTITFALSAMICGVAGALYVPQVGIISPSTLGVVFSIEIVIWAAVGGRATLIGAIIGAILVNTGRSTFSEKFPDIWSYFMGALFIIVVLVLPNGVAGTAQTIYHNIQERLAKRRETAVAPAQGGGED